MAFQNIICVFLIQFVLIQIGDGGFIPGPACATCAHSTHSSTTTTTTTSSTTAVSEVATAGWPIFGTWLTKHCTHHSFMAIDTWFHQYQFAPIAPHLINFYNFCGFEGLRLKSLWKSTFHSMHLYKHHKKESEMMTQIKTYVQPYFEFIHSLHSHHLFMYLAKHDGYRRMVMHYMGYSGCLPLEMAMPSYCCYENFMTILYRVQTSAVHARMFLMIMKYSIKLYSHPALIPVSWGHKFMAITHHRHVSSTYTHIHGHHCHPFHHYHRHAHHHLHHHHHLHAHLPHYPCHPVSPMMHPF